MHYLTLGLKSEFACYFESAAGGTMTPAAMGETSIALSETGIITRELAEKLHIPAVMRMPHLSLMDPNPPEPAPITHRSYRMAVSYTPIYSH